VTSSENFRLSIRVYIEDTDAGGIVYYVNYLKYMERGRTEFLRKLGYHKPAMPEEGMLLVVHRAEINYLRPARLDDQLEVTAEVIKMARTNVVFQQKIYADNQLLCEGLIRIACVEPKAMKPTAMPVAMREKIAATMACIVTNPVNRD